METAATRSWTSTITEHGFFLAIFILAGPLAIFYSIAPFGYWAFTKSDSITRIDAFRIGLIMLVYGTLTLTVIIGVSVLLYG